MTPDYALLQLLKLEPLNRDDIIKYTGWSEEKADTAIQECQASGAIEKRKHKCQYGYKYAVPTVRDQERSTIERPAQPKVHKLWGVWHPLHTEIRHRERGRETITTEGLAQWLHQ